MSNDILVKALRLLQNSDTCVVGSMDRYGYPAMRAMLNRREHEGMKTVCFTTNVSSRHVTEFRQNDRASVYFYDPQVFQGLLLKGTMVVSTDQDLRNQLWRDGDNVYYKLGPTDPDYCVMLFTASNGRWYENLTHHDFAL